MLFVATKHGIETEFNVCGIDFKVLFVATKHGIETKRIYGHIQSLKVLFVATKHGIETLS